MNETESLNAAKALGTEAKALSTSKGLTPEQALTYFSAGLTLMEVFGPRIKEWFGSGEITPAQQASVRARFNALRSASAFTGPEWEITPPIPLAQ